MITPDQVARVAAAGGGTIPLPPGFMAPVSLATRRGPSSWTGVSSYGGEIQIEHNRRLTPNDWRGYGHDIGFVDRMVREDPILQGLRLALTLPLLSGTWTVEPPPDPDPRETEATDIARALLFEMPAGGSWHEHLEHLLSYAWRGWSAAEVFWPFDRESGRTRLGLAPILPWTVQQWVPRPGRRWALQQLPPQGEIAQDAPPRTYGGLTLEPDDYVQVRWMPEADNPEPYGPLRACWADWMARSDYRRLEAQGFMRAAYGVPTVEVNPAAEGFDPSTATVDAVNAALQEYRAGLRAANIFPPGYSLRIAEFPFKADQIREAIVQLGHSMMTSIHATFLRTGETRGALSLHDGQVQFFGLTLGAIGERLAAAFNGPEGLLRRLLARNLPGLSRWPWLQPPQVRVGSPVELVDSVAGALASGALVDAGREVEDHIRALVGLPARQEPLSLPAPGAPPAPAPADDERTEEIVDEEDDEREDAAAAADLRLAEDVRVVGDRYQSGPGGRAVRPAERAVSYAETRGRTEAARERLGSIVEAWRRDIAPEYAEAVARAATLDAARAVPVPRQKELRERLRTELRQVYRAGTESFRAEQERIAADPALRRDLEQGRAEVGRGGDVPSPERLAERSMVHALGHRLAGWRAAGGRIEAQGRPVRAEPALGRAGLPALAIDSIDPEESIEAVLSTTVSAAVERIRSETARTLQAAGIGGAMPAPAAGRSVVAEVVAGLSAAPDVSQAQGDVNTIFGLGRQQEARAEGAERFVYSNLLESAVCGPCEALDGTVFGVEELDTYATPYSGCEGGDRCNCLVISLGESSTSGTE